MGMDLLSAVAVIENNQFEKAQKENLVPSYIKENFALILAADENDYIANVLHPDATDDELADGLIEGWESWTSSDSRSEFVLEIGGTSIRIIVRAGESWGDEPYDGFSQESAFLEAAAVYPPLGELVGFVSLDAETIAAHATNRKKN